MRLLACAVCLVAVCAGLDCDPLVPEYCMLPFPNDFWRSNTTGSLTFTNKTFPVAHEGAAKVIDPVRGGYNDLDGFSPLPPITTYFDGLDDETFHSLSFPRIWDIETSMSETSTSVLLNTATGARVAHWAELDHSSDGSPLADLHKRALIIWPAERLNSSTRYVVAIKSASGVLKASVHFQALVDGSNHIDDSRQTHFDHNIFAPLKLHLNVDRASLQQSWDFTTGSTKSVTGKLVSARDQMLTTFAGGVTPAYKITKVTQNYSTNIAYKLEAKLKVPNFLTTVLPVAASRLVLDANGLPVVQRSAWVKFEMLIPRSIANGSKATTRLVQYGHGLFGSMSEVESGYLQGDANHFGYVFVATNWVGLAEEDAPGVAAMLGSDLTNFAMIPDRCTQGMVNALAVMALMHSPKFAAESVFQTSTYTTAAAAADELQPTHSAAAQVASRSAIDTATTEYSYFGNSEGGIFGGVYMALSTQVERGLLGVSGAPYALLLPRSADFSDLFPLIKGRYSDPVDRIALLAVIQLLWDRAEPSGYLHAISREPLPGNKAHQVLFHYGLGDAQVSWLGCSIEARSVSAGGAHMFRSNVVEGNETLYGFDWVEDGTGDQAQRGRKAGLRGGVATEEAAVVRGNGIQGYTWGAPQVPFVNKPPDKQFDAHEKPRRDPRAQAMMDHFFQTGEIKNFCAGACVNQSSYNMP